MIDQAVFKLEWEILEDRYDRQHSRPTVARYYHSLSPRMSTEEYRLACRALFDRPGHYRFPGPEEFLTALDRPAEHEALDQWELCERYMRGERHILERMSPAGFRTVQLLEGSGYLGNTLEEDLHFRRQEFFRLYEHAHEIHEREKRTLPPWTREGRAIADELTKKALGQSHDHEAKLLPGEPADGPLEDWKCDDDGPETAKVTATSEDQAVVRGPDRVPQT